MPTLTNKLLPMAVAAVMVVAVILAVAAVIGVVMVATGVVIVATGVAVATGVIAEIGTVVGEAEVGEVITMAALTSMMGVIIPIITVLLLTIPIMAMITTTMAAQVLGLALATNHIKRSFF